MKNIFLIFFLFFSFSFFGQNEIQKDSVPIIDVKLFNTNYKEFKVIGSDVYAITKGDSLIKFNIKTNESSFILNEVLSITSNSKYIIGLNKENKVFKIENINDVKIINSELFKGIKKNKYFKAYKILSFKNEYLIISQSGIIFKNKLFKLTNNISSFSASKKLGLSKPDLTFIDSNNLLWMCFDLGEFGEDIVFFDLEKQRYLELKHIFQKEPYFPEKSSEYKSKMMKSYPNKVKLIDDDLYYKFPYNLPIYCPIQGIAQNNEGKFLIAQSLMHFTLSGGLVFMIENYNYTKSFLLKNLVEYEEPFFEDFLNYNIAKEYIGTCTYNKFNNSFYYYSDKGFFKIIESDTNAKKELYFKPNLKWKFGLPNSLGYQMNVLKFEFISENKMIFLTSNNGIGYYDTNSVIYFQ
jgi:hypothetical protein